jgi:hypothetical protein
MACILSGRSEDCTLIGLAQTGRGFEERLEHFWQIKCRAADDFEHLGCRRLLLERFVSLASELRDTLFPRVQRMNYDGAQPLAQRGSCALPSFDVAL